MNTNMSNTHILYARNNRDLDVQRPANARFDGVLASAGSFGVP